MKRVIAFSDSHGCAQDLRDAFMQAARGGAIDVLVFLGDGYADFEALLPIARATYPSIQTIAIRGNNDWRSHIPNGEVFMVEGVRFYACHGHEWHVKYGLDRLYYAAREREANVVLFGHTHYSCLDVEYGIFAINPGAICNRLPGKPAYAEILVEKGGNVKPRLVCWGK